MQVRINVRNPSNRVSLQSSAKTVRVAAGGGVGGSGATKIADLTDVNDDDVDHNETLVWDEFQGKYVVKTLPEIDGGTF